MGEAVLMNEQNPFNAPSHPNLLKLVSHPLEPGWDRRVTLVEGVLRPKRIVGEGVAGGERGT